MKGLSGKLKLLPDKPGIYIFRDKAGKPIYVGKAKSLKKRVSSYFSKHPDSVKTANMLSNAEDFEYITASSELEAVILESNYIKRYRPRYNIILRDDKEYPYVKVTVNEEWPRIFLVRKVEDDHARYFGPYDGSTVKETLRLIKRLFPIRLCKETPLKMRKQPCMYFYIKRCIGPCLGGSSREQYANMIEEIISLLEGRLGEIIPRMKVEMRAASDRQDYEEARSLRDRIRSLSRIEEDQAVVAHDLADKDVIAFARRSGFACAVVFKVRGGKLIDRDIFFPVAGDSPEGELTATILEQYYSLAAFVPPEILTEIPALRRGELLKLLEQKRGGPVSLSSPTRGDKAKLIEMAADNAKLLLERKMASAGGERSEEGLLELKERLSLKEVPIRIEAFDVSNIQGQDIVGSMVVFVSGVPQKKDYRKFKVKMTGKPDDVGSIYEIVRRRYGGSLAHELEMPDLILIDGGMGQVNAALRAMADARKGGMPIIGLAKRFEEIFVPGRKSPLKLAARSKALKLLQRARDEAHRFAITFHRQRRRKRLKLR